MKPACVLIATMVLLCSTAGLSEPTLEGRDLVRLEGKAASAVVDLGGGSIVDFHRTGHGLNPLCWNYPEKGDTQPRWMGHFICCDRWGQPSAGEEARGVPFHGEASHVRWVVEQSPEWTGNTVTAVVRCEMPMAGLAIRKTLRLAENEAVLKVREEITNQRPMGRLYNIVQHATLAPPFLDEHMVVDTKVGKGFAQYGELPYPEEPVITWPQMVYEGQLVDFRRLAGYAGPDVVSFVFDDDREYGWVTASNAAQGLLIGYIWETAQYPWMNFWLGLEEGKPAAYAFEFGTTGLHMPYSTLFQKDRIFGGRRYGVINACRTIE